MLLCLMLKIVFFYFLYLFFTEEENEKYIFLISQKKVTSQVNRNGVTTDVKKKSESGLLIKKNAPITEVHAYVRKPEVS